MSINKTRTPSIEVRVRVMLVMISVGRVKTTCESAMLPVMSSGNTSELKFKL